MTTTKQQEVLNRFAPFKNLIGIKPPIYSGRNLAGGIYED